jgi:hypothetical protein
MKWLKYIIAFAPIVLLTYIKHLMDAFGVTNPCDGFANPDYVHLQYVYKLSLFTCFAAMYLLPTLNRKEDKPFEYWCQSLAGFVLVNNSYDLWSAVLHLTPKTFEWMATWGRWEMFGLAVSSAIYRTWKYNRDKKWGA